MTRHSVPTRRPSTEERQFFEALIALRARHADGTEDVRPVIALHHAIALANAEMRTPAPPPPVIRLGIEAN